MTRSVDIRVTGRVQGVSFRYHAHAEACRLGVFGWVRNEPDGSVAAHLEGDPESVDAMLAWCREGPAYARVVGVDVRTAEPTDVRCFDVRD